jgi:DNA-binding MltR family transcriptional regulator
MASKKDTLYSLARERNSSPEDKQAYFAELGGESDRSCALIASSYVEHALVDLIRTSLIYLSEAEVDALFFARDATLGTFSKQIDIAYALGLIMPQQRTDLDRIRKIRNTFAHAIKSVRFADALLAAEISKLSKFTDNEGPRQFDHFKSNYIASCHDLSLDLIETAARNVNSRHASAVRANTLLQRRLQKLEQDRHEQEQKKQEIEQSKTESE